MRASRRTAHHPALDDPRYESPDPEQATKDLVKQLETFIDINAAAEQAPLDDVLDRRHTRRTICEALARTANKKVERPARKTGGGPV